MKKVLFILSVLFFISCSNKSPQNKEADIFLFDVKEEESTIRSYEDIAVQKLQNYVDLLKLKNEHPEFKKQVTLQLEKISTNRKFHNKFQDFLLVKNIHKVGEEITLNDSVKKLKLAFELVKKSSVKYDSVDVKIKINTIILEGENFVNNEVLF